MPYFPNDPTKFRPAKFILQIDVLREVDRAIQEGLGGYENRHELANDLLEQGLINLRYPDGEEPMLPTARSEAESKTASSNGQGDAAGVSAPNPTANSLPNVKPLGGISETRISVPAEAGTAVENKLAAVPNEPMFGMHNRDAPSAWALARLAAEAFDGPVPLGDFYEKATEDAWKLAARLVPLEVRGEPKLAVMLPRNANKPQSASDGFRAFALGQVARKPADGKLAAWGPFYQWAAVGIVGDPKNPEIGLTESGWELVKLFNGLDFALPHSDEIAQRFLAHLEQHAPADHWGFRTALEGAGQNAGRVELSEYFAKRLPDDFSDAEWKGSVADSVASGYVSRARAWGLIEMKLAGGKYSLTSVGGETLKKLSAGKVA